MLALVGTARVCYALSTSVVLLRPNQYIGDGATISVWSSEPHEGLRRPVYYAVKGVSNLLVSESKIPKFDYSNESY